MFGLSVRVTYAPSTLSISGKLIKTEPVSPLLSAPPSYPSPRTFSFSCSDLLAGVSTQGQALQGMKVLTSDSLRLIAPILQRRMSSTISSAINTVQATFTAMTLPKTYTAMTIKEKGKFEKTEVELKQPQDGQVLVKVRFLHPFLPSPPRLG